MRRTKTARPTRPVGASSAYPVRVSCSDGLCRPCYAECPAPVAICRPLLLRGRSGDGAAVIERPLDVAGQLVHQHSILFAEERPRNRSGESAIEDEAVMAWKLKAGALDNKTGSSTRKRPTSRYANVRGIQKSMKHLPASFAHALLEGLPFPQRQPRPVVSRRRALKWTAATDPSSGTDYVCY